MAAKSKELDAVSTDLKKWTQAAKLLKGKNKELEALVKSLTEANAKHDANSSASAESEAELKALREQLKDRSEEAEAHKHGMQLLSAS